MAKRSKGGRPEWKPTQAEREQVEISAGGGMRHEEIALALGVSTPTLRKHLAQELAAGANKRRMDVVDAVYRAGLKGNAAAARAYLSAVPEVGALDPGKGADEKPGEPLGKKAQANEAAKTAQVGTSWEDVLPGGASQRIQ